jgi:hypothetical protein
MKTTDEYDQMVSTIGTKKIQEMIHDFSKAQTICNYATNELLRSANDFINGIIGVVKRSGVPITKGHGTYIYLDPQNNRKDNI